MEEMNAVIQSYVIIFTKKNKYIFWQGNYYYVSNIEVVGGSCTMEDMSAILLHLIFVSPIVWGRHEIR